MTANKKLMQQAIDLIEQRGQEAVEKSRQIALEDKTLFKPLDDSIKYFMDEFWFDFLHPALISLACEAVGGKKEDAVQIGAAMVLLAGAADIHDDIIDESKIKEPYETVFGKFGRDIAILAGDTLLLKGAYLLNETAFYLSKKKSTVILESIKKAFFELCGAEAREASIRRKNELSKTEYLDILKHKSTSSEAAMRIGAVLGGGTEKEIELLGHYGRTFGLLMNLRNEFIDVFEEDELQNRLQKECLPIPILLAFGESDRKEKIMNLLNKLSAKNIKKIVDLSLGSKETTGLVKKMKKWAEEEISLISTLTLCKAELGLLLCAALEDL
jgi:geranylgeranyl pyrophosphate synthase